MKTLGDRIGKAKPRLATTRQVRDRRYSADATVRGWYKSARWQRLRLEVFLRDAYRDQRTGQIAAGKHPAPDSPVANHKVPHHGDPGLFWDIDNIETVTKATHDSLIQAEERGLASGA